MQSNKNDWFKCVKQIFENKTREKTWINLMEQHGNKHYKEKTSSKTNPFLYSSDENYSHKKPPG